MTEEAFLICNPTADGPAAVPSTTRRCVTCGTTCWVSIRGSLPTLARGARVLCWPCGLLRAATDPPTAVEIAVPDDAQPAYSGRIH